MFGKAKIPITLDRPRHLVYDFNAMVALERALGENVLEADFWAKPLTAIRLRAFLWAGLLREDPALTIEAAGELMTENLETMSAPIAAAIRESQPEPGSTSRPTDGDAAPAGAPPAG